MNQTLIVTKFFENWTKTKTKNYLWSIFLWNWKSIEETNFFFFFLQFIIFIILLMNFVILLWCINFCLSWLEQSLGMIGYCACIIMSHLRKLFLEFSLQKWERPHAFSNGTHFYKIPTMIYSPRLLMITHAQRNITSAASRANDMPIYDR